MKLIPIYHHSLLVNWCRVDDKDYDNLIQYLWTMHTSGYARRSDEHRPTIYMHREIMETPPRLHTDHINGDLLDNRRANLRIVTPGQNAQNKQMYGLVSGISKSRGVYVDKERGGFRASMKLNQKTINIGRFKTRAEAEAAVSSERRRLMPYSEMDKMSLHNYSDK